MKKPKLFTKPLLPVIALLIFGNLYFMQQGFSAGKSSKEILFAKEEPVNKVKSFSARNNNAVRIHPATIKREMHVVAKENNGKEISFFVFDLNGTLIQLLKMKHKEHYRLTGLEKGIYFYRVFCGDEETVSGKFEIR